MQAEVQKAQRHITHLSHVQMSHTYMMSASARHSYNLVVFMPYAGSEPIQFS